MFQSSGYFRGVNCPYYLNGLCERAYCHFRHVKQVLQPEAATVDPTPSSTLLSMVGDAIQAVQQDIAFGKAKSQERKSDLTYSPVKPKTKSANAPVERVYRPTPLSQLETNESKRSSPPATKSSVYTPTPIEQLSKLDRGVAKRHNDVMGAVPTKKQKLECTSADSAHNELNEVEVNQSEKAVDDCKTVEQDDSIMVLTPDETMEQKLNHETTTTAASSETASGDAAVAIDFVKEVEHTVTAAVDPLQSKKLTEANEKHSEAKVTDAKEGVKTDTETIKDKTAKSKDEKISSHKSHKHHKKHKHSDKSNKDRKGDKHKAEKTSNLLKKIVTLKNCDLFGDDSDDENITLSPLRNDDSESENKSKSNSGDKEKRKGSRHKHTSHKSSKDRHRSSSKTSSDRKDRHSSRSESKKKVKSVSKDDHEPPLEDDIEVEMIDIADDELYGDRYEECLRIFNESNGAICQSESSDMKPAILTKKDETVTEGESSYGRKRVAHSGGENAKLTRQIVPNKPVRMSASQIMHNRFAEIAKQQQKTSNSVDDKSKRVAHQPKAGSALLQKSKRGKVITPAERIAALKESDEPTRCGMPQTEKRFAHVPKKEVMRRPTIPSEFGNKIPSKVRQQYLNRIIDETLKLCPEEEQAYQQGLAEEQNVYDRATSKAIYMNLAINTIKKLRDEQSKKDNVMSPVKVSHAAMLGGLKGAKTSFTLNRSKKKNAEAPKKFSPSDLYKNLQRYILSEEELIENGFPRATDIPGVAEIPSKNTQSPSKTSAQLERVCVRCGKRFNVLPQGGYLRPEECQFHWGKHWRRKIAGAWQQQWTCCQGDSDSHGCSQAPRHVHEHNRTNNLSGYMKTIPCSPPPEGDFGVYALDCEMIYTLEGSSLARVTVIDCNCESVYEMLVRPECEILDYNTRFSGLTESDLANVTTSIQQVQAVLLSLFNSQTILIGHSLESDLVALKLIHPTCVDTSVVFPHRLGPPYKRALKTIMSDVLQKIIQEDVGGHDSKEDAVSCMELMIHKAKEDYKKEN